MDKDIEAISGLLPRRLLAIAGERLREEPVLALQGPRAVGKSTLLGELARSSGVEVVDLDDPAVRTAARADPGAFVDGPPPVCIDEYQHVPEVLDAIKSELNRDLRPGRFVLTGSTSYEALPTAAQSLTGRLHLLSVLPLTQGEIEGTRENLLEALLAGSEPEEVLPRGVVSRASKAQYVERALAGGMPIPLARRDQRSRGRWFDDYVRLVLERDVRELSRLRRRAQLPQLLRRLAAQTAQVLNLSTLASASGLDRTTIADYVALLEAVFLVVRLPAWGTTLRRRVGGAPKIHIVDSGLAARLLGLTSERLGRRDATALSQFGRLLETFAVGELLRQASWRADEIAACGHWRTYDGDEIDLVVERRDGGVVAFEIKAAGRVAEADLHHLRKLREALGERFLLGVALYTGTSAYRADDRLHVLPIDRIWARL